MLYCMPLCLLVTLGQVHVLRKGNVVNVDVNPFPSPDFSLPSIAQCWWGCSPLRGVQPGMQTEGYEHEHESSLLANRSENKSISYRIQYFLNL
jgi:hypothetical protein